MNDSKLKAALYLAKLRGYKKLTDNQMQLLEQLLQVEGLSVVEALEESIRKPRSVPQQAIKNIRNLVSRHMSAVAEVLKTN